jgi:hypothetical protein
MTRNIMRRTRVLWGNEHPSILGHLRALAKALRSKGDLVASETVSRYCILLTMNTPGWDQKDTIRYKDMIEALEALAETLFSLERWDEAAVRFEEIYQSVDIDQASEDEQEIKLRNRLRKCYSMQGLYSEGNEFETKLSLLRECEMTTNFMKDNMIRKWGRLERDDDEAESRPGKRTCTSWPGKEVDAC